MISRLPDIWDEPFADVSQIPTYLVSQVARQQVTVSLSGDGGDELFAGYNRHAWLDRVWGRAAAVPTGARRSAGAALGRIPPAAVERVARATSFLRSVGRSETRRARWPSWPGSSPPRTPRMPIRP